MARAPLPSLADIAKLPPDGGPEFNRLIFASSPYLLQHARNPVDWYPWGPVAFEHARATAKPIFLSIGYSTCHWCHVMEHESFEDAEVAKLLNEYFVCVKVDREERPDVDAVYMTVTQGMTGSGGWPMTVFLTPEREPFFAATYIPKHSVGERSGMLELVPEVGLAWRAEREKLVTTGRSATEWLRKRMRQPDGVELNAEVLQRAEQGLASSYDAQWGGFGSAPKFPTPHNLRLLLRRWNRSGDQRSLDMVLATLRSMRAGGIWDHVGFGFHRYSTDRQWLLPHFEKMLCDQASIALAYVEAWQVSGAADLRRTAEEIFAYVLRDMTAPEGGFYSAEDADSEGEEGRFHTWTRAEITSALGAEDAAFAAEVWDVRDSGNFTEQSTGRANGRNVLHLPADVATIAKRKGVPPSELEARVEAVRARLFAGREKRVHPLKDDKILTDWNGLMIAALAHGGRAFGEARYVEAASRAAEFVLTRLRSADGRLKKSLRAGSASGAAVHDDYAFLVWGLLELHETTGDPRWLKTSLELVELERVLFADAASGGFFLSAHDTEHLIARPKTAQDGALPSGNSVSALNHLRLARLTGRTELEQRANQSLRAFGAAIRQTPEAHTQFLTALDFVQGPSFELVVAGPAGSTEMQSVLARIHRVFAPHKVVLVKPDGDAGKAVSELAPYTASQLSLESKPTVYLCRSFTCELPTHDVASVIEKLRPSQKK